MTKHIQLTLFFTKGVSLGTWDSVGMLSRELAIYRELKKRGLSIRFVTYGGPEEMQFKKDIQGIDLRHNHWKLPIELYVKYLGLRLDSGGNQIYKSNQMNGAEIALQLARRKGAKFIARSGYLFSLDAERAHGYSSTKAKQARALERHIFMGADRIVVTTQLMAETIRERYRLSERRVRVIPNNVQTSVFAPASSGDTKKQRVIYIGRLSQEKNVNLLIEAMDGIDAELCIAGEGVLRNELEALAKKSKVDVRFLGAVQNNRLPELLNSGQVFVLPSKYEGHPKALIEAMSCELAVVGSDVPGIREIIRHNDNGMLCEESPESIREAIKVLLGSKTLRKRLGRVARKDIEDHFSLEGVTELEYKLLQEMVQE